MTRRPPEGTEWTKGTQGTEGTIYLTREQLAARWQASVRKIDELIEEKRIEYFRIGRAIRFPIKGVEAFEASPSRHFLPKLPQLTAPQRDILREEIRMVVIEVLEARKEAA